MELKLDSSKQVSWEYDKGADVLYVSFGKPQPALSLDMGSGIVLRYLKGREIVGFTIIGVREVLRPELSERVATPV